jgi:outer membrane protein W
VLIGLSFNYIYPKYRFKPYAGLGAMYTITFSDESAYVRYTFHNYDPKSKSFGYLLNAGLIFELSEHFSIKFHAEQMISLFNIGTSSNYGINSDNLNIVLGLQYRMHK